MAPGPRTVKGCTAIACCGTVLHLTEDWRVGLFLYMVGTVSVDTAWSILKTDNTPRVRDGYSSLRTRGHTRTSATQIVRPICREKVPADARA